MAKRESKRKGKKSKPKRDPTPEPTPAPLKMEPSIGDDTRAAISRSGIIEHEKTSKRLRRLLGLLLLVIVASIGLDLAGVIHIPGVALRQIIIEPTASEETPRGNGAFDHLTPAEREKLRRSLIGGGEKPRGPATPSGPSRRAMLERQMLEEIHHSGDKEEATVKMPTTQAVAVPAGGPSQKAILKVIQDNQRAIHLCLSEAMRRGEKPAAKMEVTVTIAPSGNVTEVEVDAPVRGSLMGSCTSRRIRAWRFPPFEGDTVSVVFPFFLGAQ